VIDREGGRIELNVIQCLPLGVLENHLLSTVLYGILGSHLVGNLIVLITQSCFNTIQASGKVRRRLVNFLKMLKVLVI
jgi:hypothetical protein